MTTSIDWSASADHRAALHEAGHAAIGRLLGLACSEASIVPDGDRLGYAVVEPPWVGWERGDGKRAPVMEAFIVMSKAGAEAERQFISGGDHIGYDDEDRVREAYRHFRIRGRHYIGDEVEQAHDDRMRKRTTRLVRQNRATIARVALALIEKHRLTGEEIDDVMAPPVVVTSRNGISYFVAA